MTTEQYQTVSYEIKDHVAVISLTRVDQLNAINTRMRAEMLSILKEVETNDTVRIALLCAQGRGFGVGQDLTEAITDGEATKKVLMEEYLPVLEAIDSSTKIFIAAVNGPAAGVSGSVAMACDLIIMSDDAYLYQAFVAIGLIPDGGACWQLVKQLGYRRALEIVLEGAKISAQECLELGLVNRVVALDDLQESAMIWAEELAQKAPLAMAGSKLALKKAQNTDFVSAIEIETEIQAKMAETEDVREGVTAFFEKKTPNFKGR